MGKPKTKINKKQQQQYHEYYEAEFLHLKIKARPVEVLIEFHIRSPNIAKMHKRLNKEIIEEGKTE